MHNRCPDVCSIVQYHTTFIDGVWLCLGTRRQASVSEGLSCFEKSQEDLQVTILDGLCWDMSVWALFLCNLTCALAWLRNSHMRYCELIAKSTIKTQCCKNAANVAQRLFHVESQQGYRCINRKIFDGEGAVDIFVLTWFCIVICMAFAYPNHRGNSPKQLIGPAGAYDRDGYPNVPQPGKQERGVAILQSEPEWQRLPESIRQCNLSVPRLCY